MPIQYKHGSVELKEITEIDIETLRMWRNDPAIYNWCRQTGLIMEANQQKWFEKIAFDNSIQMFGVHDNLSLIGVVGLTDIDYIHSKAEFSIYIAPKYQGKGHGESALKCLFDFGFKDMGLNRIWGETYQGNIGLKLYPKLGFKQEGHLKKTYYKKGEFVDSFIFAILKEEWLTR